jgi:hypothetical protein
VNTDTYLQTPDVSKDTRYGVWTGYYAHGWFASAHVALAFARGVADITPRTKTVCITAPHLTDRGAMHDIATLRGRME